MPTTKKAFGSGTLPLAWHWSKRQAEHSAKRDGHQGKLTLFASNHSLLELEAAA